MICDFRFYINNFYFMFDEQTPTSASNAPSAATTPTSQPEVNAITPPAADDIHTMPMEYYLGANTVAATNSGKPIQARPAVGAQMNAGTAVVGKKKWVNYVLIGGLVVVVGISAFLLFKSYQKPAATTTTQSVIEDMPEPEPAVVAETDATVEIVSPPEVVVAPETIELKKFDPAELNKFTLGLMLGADGDNDGLTDAEETLFGTDPAMMDSDGDIYKDAEEILSLYSPVDSGAIRLFDKKDIVNYYTNPKYGYKLLYPSTWLIQPLNSDDPNDLMIISNQNEFLDVLVYDKKAAQSLKNWYLEMVPTVNATDLKEYQTLKKLNALESPDGFTVYIEGTSKDKVYAVNYNIGLKEQASFSTVFFMAVQSFELTPVTAVPVSGAKAP